MNSNDDSTGSLASEDSLFEDVKSSLDDSSSSDGSDLEVSDSEFLASASSVFNNDVSFSSLLADGISSSHDSEFEGGSSEGSLSDSDDSNSVSSVLSSNLSTSTFSS